MFFFKDCGDFCASYNEYIYILKKRITIISIKVYKNLIIFEYGVKNLLSIKKLIKSLKL